MFIFSFACENKIEWPYFSACILCILCSASCDTLLGSRECSWGPSYWCSHARNAKACGAVQHCLDTVWSKQIIKEDSQVSCLSLWSFQALSLKNILLFISRTNLLVKINGIYLSWIFFWSNENVDWFILLSLCINILKIICLCQTSLYYLFWIF